MKITLIPFIVIALFCSMLSISACSTLEKNRKSAVCNQLNSEIVFNGSTSDTREVEIQDSQQARIRNSYDNNGC